MQMGMLHFGDEGDRPEPDLRVARHTVDISAELRVPSGISGRVPRGVDRGLEIHLVIVPGWNDHLHPLAEQRPEAGPRLHHRIPILGLLVPAPVERAEIVDHA